MVISLDEVSLFHGSRAVLDQISYDFPEGKTTVVLGASGSGKSVLLKVAAGILPPDRGRITVDGQAIAGMSERQNREFRRSCGFVFQDAALWSNSTLLQNMNLPLRYHQPEMSDERIRERVDELMERIGFVEDLTLRPADTSLGERKIVSFIRAVVTDPATLFLDEPFAGIHHEVSDRMMEFIRGLKRQGKTVIVVTHDPVLTSQVADWLVVLRRGRVIAGGPKNEVISSADREVSSILTRVLSQASTFDDSILDILDQGMEGLDEQGV